MRALHRLAWGMFAVTMFADEARALRFELRRLDSRDVLLLFDCGRGDRRDGKTQCNDWEGGFSNAGPLGGDASRLARELGQRRYEEVWLFSGGGIRDQGIELGRVLRRHRVVVRVPSFARLRASAGPTDFEDGGRCVSACSLAFMGGLLRYVDEGAELMIHSSSSFADSVPRRRYEFIQTNGFRAFAEMQRTDACHDVLRTLRYFQNTLLLPTGSPALREDEVFVRAEARSCTNASWYDAAMESRDNAQFALEGAASLQDILMRIERGAVKSAIAAWEARIATLGKRAEPALRMVAARFDVAILSANSLSRESLISMGYVTREVAKGPPDHHGTE